MRLFVQLCTLTVLSAQAAVSLAHGQSPATPAAVTETTVCAITNHPSNYDGKTVRLTGTVQAGFDSFILRADSCSTPLWLSFPAGTKAKSGPAISLTLSLAAGPDRASGRPALTLARGAGFDQFEKLLTEKVKLPGMCLGCVKNDVKATLVGRIDGVDEPGLKRDASGKFVAIAGFGNLNVYPAQLVIQSISDVSAQPIDFTRIPSVPGDQPGGNQKDFMTPAKKAEEAFPKGSPAIATIERALAAFGAPGVANGVEIDFTGANETPGGGAGKPAAASPDGLLLTVHVDGDRLKGDALSRAIAHEGEEIADLREADAKAGEPDAQTLEEKAWQTTLLVVLGSRQKSLTLPGGVLFYDANWPQAELNQNIGEALTHYVRVREQLPR
jgi:hypothetical protein